MATVFTENFSRSIQTTRYWIIERQESLQRQSSDRFASQAGIKGSGGHQGCGSAGQERHIGPRCFAPRNHIFQARCLTEGPFGFYCTGDPGPCRTTAKVAVPAEIPGITLLRVCFPPPVLHQTQSDTDGEKKVVIESAVGYS